MIQRHVRLFLGKGLGLIFLPLCILLYSLNSFPIMNINILRVCFYFSRDYGIKFYLKYYLLCIYSINIPQHGTNLIPETINTFIISPESKAQNLLLSVLYSHSSIYSLN